MISETSPETTPSDRELKRRAHGLKPIVKTGANGLTEAVLDELDRALIAHELVKIRVAAEDRGSRADMIEHACKHLSARCIFRIGHTATLYRASPVDSNNA